MILIPFDQGRRKGSAGVGWDPTAPIAFLIANKIKDKRVLSTVI